MGEVGYILFAHGSSMESANEEVRRMAAQMAQAGGFPVVETAFLELAQPDLSGAVAKIADRVSRIVVVPYFLSHGIHLRRDLPNLIEEIRAARPGLDIRAAPPISEHAGVIDLLVNAARKTAEKNSDRKATDPTESHG